MTLDRNTSAGMRGLAIVLIVLHNVLHLSYPFCENEFGFSSNDVEKFFEALPEAPVSATLVFFGWMGVAAFVFLSGYGLEAKYGDSQLSIGRFLKRHYLKLIILTAPCMFIMMVKSNIGIYLLEQSLLLNIVDPARIVPGIYWYVGLAIQLYIAFLALRRLPSRALIAVAVAGSLVMALSDDGLQFYFRHNIVGWLPEFVAGMLWQRVGRPVFEGRWTRLAAFVLFAALLVAVSLTRYTYYLGGVCFVGMMLAVPRRVYALWALRRLGALSASVYVVHAVARAVWTGYCPFSDDVSLMAGAWIVLAVSVAASVVYNIYYEKATRRL